MSTLIGCPNDERTRDFGYRLAHTLLGPSVIASGCLGPFPASLVHDGFDVHVSVEQVCCHVAAEVVQGETRDPSLLDALLENDVQVGRTQRLALRVNVSVPVEGHEQRPWPGSPQSQPRFQEWANPLVRCDLTGLV